ncbi:MAG TPA: hypothetical protein VFJ51_04155, partial [Nitrososphaeraceae archaeon]|nr:hypothetical protein [Nitrososphaeraceae archaeon]
VIVPLVFAMIAKLQTYYISSLLHLMINYNDCLLTRSRTYKKENLEGLSEMVCLTCIEFTLIV